MMFALLHKICSVFEDYFKDVEEESIRYVRKFLVNISHFHYNSFLVLFRDNFVIIYELLDELVDFGYPQTTDGKILQEYITQEGHKLEGGLGMCFYYKSG